MRIHFYARWVFMGTLCLAINAHATEDPKNTTSANASTSTTKSGSANNSQNGAQKTVSAVSSQGSSDAKDQGLDKIVTGGIEIWTGMASTPVAYPVVALGAWHVLQGVKGLQGAKKLKENADIAGGQFQTLDSSLGGNGNNPTIGNGIQVTPDDLKNGKVGELMESLQNKTGITPTAMAQALNSGLDTEGFLKKFKGPLKLSDSQAKALASSANAKYAKGGGNVSGSAGDASGKPVDLAGASYAESGGSGGAKSGGGGSDKSLEDFLKGMKGEEEGKGVDTLDAKLDNLSPEVKDTLAKNGITDKSIFAMVRSQYDKNSYMMFGQENKEDTAAIVLPDGPGTHNGRLPAALPRSF